MSMLEEKFNNGLTPGEFEDKLGENKDLHDLHYRRNDVTKYVAQLRGTLGDLRCLIITEPWCGDSLAIVPTLLKFFEDFPELEVRFVLRDENPDLIDLYLTNGGRAIPRIIMMDDRFNELFNWGPRPRGTQAIMDEYRDRIKSGKIDKMVVIKKIRTFYSKDRGKAIMDEFIQKLFQR